MDSTLLTEMAKRDPSSYVVLGPLFQSQSRFHTGTLRLWLPSWETVVDGEGNLERRFTGLLGNMARRQRWVPATLERLALGS